MIRRPPRSTLDRSSAASDVYKRQVIVERDPAVFLAALEHSYGFSNCRDPGDAPLLFVGVIEAQRRPDEAVLARLRELDPEVLQRPAVEHPAHQQLPANLAARAIVADVGVVDVPGSGHPIEQAGCGRLSGNDAWSLRDELTEHVLSAGAAIRHGLTT